MRLPGRASGGVAEEPGGASGSRDAQVSNLPTGMTLDDFEYGFHPSVERSRVETPEMGRGSGKRRRFCFRILPGSERRISGFGRSNWAFRRSTIASTS